ncbi:serine--tRNA ligase [Candidatus Collierbacteria bacterium CG09_land_8_20_14_0_10_46_12]|uniref:Serine--tRNA ligase n=1 Tax=Candidatus Collierbacteria bacterium CG09_land_8_20_14_0_10_46_12 TaxID=1974533 RepID=A0A2H0X199_9BACT|nr:MAG: serine--tRNA ligase [Candidatus Collierbacteria bacterium CG09_land_8_20_14_0_10_46_12]
MLDIQYIRDNKEAVKNATIDKGFDGAVVDKIIEVDIERRKLIGRVEEIRAKKNKLGRDQIEEGRALKIELKAIEENLNIVTTTFNDLMLRVPNPSAPDVKVGKEEDNEVIKQVGKPREFSFPVRDHLDLGLLTGTIDIPNGTKVAQSGFYYIKGDGALLEFALMQYVMMKLAEKGFIPVITPNVASEKSVIGCGFQARSDKERQIYHIEGEDLDLIATAEITLVGQHADTTFSPSDLPLKYVGYSYCYRYEKGSYGKDVRGILRVHEFRKVEMVVFCLPENSDALHEELRGIEEEIWQELEIPYQLIKMATGDLGNAASRKYDIEAWMPSQGRYREVTSTSNTTDFQARRLGIKVRRNNENEYVHTINGTALALGRAMIAIYENYQNEDGSITVPKVLQKWMEKVLIPVK